MPGLLDECIRKEDEEEASVFLHAMQVYLISFRTPAHLFPVCNLCSDASSFLSSEQTSLSCDASDCDVTSRGVFIKATVWLPHRQENNSTRFPWRAVTDVMLVVWMFKPSEKEISFNEDRYQGLHCFELSDPWRWPLHSSVCGIICCSPSTHEMKNLH